MRTGGKAIASGGYGCVFRPALKCKDETDRSTGVSKLMKKKYALEEYTELNKFLPVLEKIPHYEKYFLIKGITMCDPDKLGSSDKINFSMCTNLGNINSSNVNSHLDRLQILNLPDGGEDLHEFFMKRQSIDDFIRINTNMMALLKHAIVPMNELKLIHNDLKSQNIMIHPDNYLPKIIDWGLSAYNFDPEDNLSRPIHFNLPFSGILPNAQVALTRRMLIKDHKSEQYLIDNKTALIIKYVKKVIYNDAQSGHYHYWKQRIVPLLDSILKESTTIDEIIHYYLYTIVATFSEIEKIGDKYNLVYQNRSYIQNIYLYNADKCGFIMCYLPLLTNLNIVDSKKQRINREKEKEIQLIVAKLIKYALLTASQVMSTDYICEQLTKINDIIKPDVSKPVLKISTQAPIHKPNVMTNKKKKRCPKGTHRNHKTGNCDPNNQDNKSVGPAHVVNIPVKSKSHQHTVKVKKLSKHGKRPRCPNGTRRNPKTGNCEPVNK